METISLLTCLKLRYPDRVQLIRGNHESRAVTQVQFPNKNFRSALTHLRPTVSTPNVFVNMDRHMCGLTSQTCSTS